MVRTFGSDPELLIVNGDSPKSAIGIVKGTSQKRIKCKSHAFYYDNVLAEFALRPAKSKKETIANFKQALKIYAKLVRPYKLKPQASVCFPDEELLHPEARIVGCSRDNCAYKLVQVEPPETEIKNGNLRSCGGHIHVGCKSINGDGPEPILFIYLLDLFLGVPSLWLDKDPTSKRRRKLYGQAGRYRVQKYGVEYRPLGNFWLGSPALVGLIYDLTNHALDMIENKKAWDLWDFSWDKFLESEDGSLAAAWTCKAYNSKLLQEGINEGDTKKVLSHFRLAKELLPQRLNEELQELIDRPEDDFYKNWGLT